MEKEGICYCAGSHACSSRRSHADWDFRDGRLSSLRYGL